MIKEAEPGFDGQYLGRMKEQLAEAALLLSSPACLWLNLLESVTKGRSRGFLNVQTLIAGGMQRRFAQLQGAKPKGRSGRGCD